MCYKRVCSRCLHHCQDVSQPAVLVSHLPAPIGVIVVIPKNNLCCAFSCVHTSADIKVRCCRWRFHLQELTDGHWVSVTPLLKMLGMPGRSSPAP